MKYQIFCLVQKLIKLFLMVEALLTAALLSLAKTERVAKKSSSTKAVIIIIIIHPITILLLRSESMETTNQKVKSCLLDVAIIKMSDF